MELGDLAVRSRPPPSGAVGGIRIVLEIIRRRRDLRERFPRALSEGASGEFASWARVEGLKLLGLTTEKGAWIDAAFSSEPGAVARQLLFFNKDLQERQPLFLLPEGREATCQTLFAANADVRSAWKRSGGF